ncbi:MAG: ABC transporter permease [Bacteroidota bacterium]|nr:ABC transporter permease [Bacteroidota bacterium]
MSHKERSILTGLGIVWGIFILIILLGLGNGFRVGTLMMFDGFNKETSWVYCGQTSEPYKGLQAGRKILLKYDDLLLLKKSIIEIENISPELTNWAGSLMSYKNNFTRINVKGVNPDYFKIKILNTSQGRIINYLDNKDKRRVVLLGKNTVEVLFKKENPIGKYINIDNNFFLVIGVIDSGILNPFEDREVYIPYHSFSELYSQATDIQIFLYSIKDNSDALKIEKRIKGILARKFNFSEKDDKTLFFNRLKASIDSFNKLFDSIKYFLWIMGISTLLSGVIGVGNIMFVIVKERTKEIGIRKAIGAKPINIKLMILIEAIIFTLFAGIIGMILGIGMLQIINIMLKNMELLIKETIISIPTAIAAIFILIISGTIAGLIPANKAANVSPITALKDE